MYDATNTAAINVTGTQTLSGVMTNDLGNVAVSSTGPYTGATFASPVVNNNVVVTPATTSVTISGAQYTTMAGVSISGSASGNYYVAGVTPSSLTANITPASLVITAVNQASFYSQTPNSVYSPTSNSLVTYVYSGLRGSDTVTGATTAAVVSNTNLTPLTASSAAGTYAAVVSNATGSGLSNYTITYVPGIYTVVPAGQLLIKTNGTTTPYGTPGVIPTPVASYLDATGNTITSLVHVSTGSGGTPLYTYQDAGGATVSFNIVPANPTLSGSNNTNAGTYGLQVANLQLTNTSNLTSTQAVVTGNMTVTPLAVTVSATPTTHVYNGSAQSQSAYTSSPAILSGDAVTINGGVATGTSVGAYASNLSATGADAANYKFAFSNANLTITPYIIVPGANSGPQIVATANNKVYDTTTAATGSLALTGLFGSDSLSAAYTTAAFASPVAATGTTVTFTGMTLSGPSAANYSIGTTSPLTATANITPAPVYLTSGLTAQNKVYNTTTADTVILGNSVGMSGVYAADGTNVTSPTAGSYANSFAFSQSNVGVGLAVTPILSSGAISGLTLGGTKAGNYYIAGVSQAGLTANITPAPVYINGGLTANNKMYDTTTAGTISSGVQTLSGVLGGDTANVAVSSSGTYSGTFASANVNTNNTPITVTVNTTTTNINGVNYTTVAGASLSGSASGNYYVAGVSQSLSANITPAPLTITANNAASFVTQSISSVGYTVNGLLGTDAIASATTAAVDSQSVALQNSAAAGSYVTTVNTAVGAAGTLLSNYAISYKPGIYTVVPAGQLLITTTGTTTPYGTAGVIPAPTVAYETTGNVVINNLVAGTPVTTNGITTYTYSDGAGTTLSFSLAPSNTTLSGSGNINVGTYGLVATNFTKSGGNLTSNSAVVTGDYNVVPLAVTITSTPTTVVYNGTQQTQSGYTTSTPILAGDYVAVSGLGAGTNVGTYNSTLAVAGTTAGNNTGDYQFTLVDKALTITPYIINFGSNSGSSSTSPQIAATANSKQYDTTTTTTGSLSMTHLFGSDVVTASYSAANFNNANAAQGKTVTFTGITLSGAAAANYQIGTAPVTATANITPAPILISGGLAADNKVYDTTTAATIKVTGTQTLTGVFASDVANVAANSTGPYIGTFANANVGNGIAVTPMTSTSSGITSMTGVTLNGSASGNYYVAGVSNGLLAANITPAPVYITGGLAAQSKTYDTTNAAVVNTTGAQTLSGVLGNDVVGVVAPTGGSYANSFVFSTANAGNNLAVTPVTGSSGAVTGITLTGAQGANYYVAGVQTTPALTANITPAPVYITSGLAGQNKVYDATNAAGVSITGTLGLSGVLGSDNLKVNAPTSGTISNSFTFAQSDVQNSIAINPVLTNSGAISGMSLISTTGSAANYYIAGTSSNLLAANITPAPLTISAGLSAQSKTYDTTTAATITVSGPQTLSGVMSADLGSVAVAPVSSYVGSFSQPTVGNGLTVSPDTQSTVIGGVTYTTMAGVSLTGAKAGNYYVTGPTTALTANITKAILTITATNQASFVTQTPNDVSSNSVVGYVATGLLGNDAVASVANITANLTAVTAANSATGLLSSSTPAGTYFTNVSGATGTGLSNYTINYVPGVYTVVPAGQLMIKTNGAVTTYGTLPNYSSTNPVSPVAQYMSTSGGNAISTITLSSATNNGITTYSGNDGAGTNISFNIVPANPVISGSGNTSVGAYGLTTANFTVTGNNISNPQAVVTGNLQVTPLAVTINATPTSLVYNGANQNQSAYTTSPAILTNDAVTISGAVASGKNVGTYASNISTSGADAANYQFTYNNADLVITPYVINFGSGGNGPNLSANANSRVYNATTTATGSLALTGLFAGDVVNASYASANFANANAGTGKTVTFTGINFSGPAASNYVMSSASGATPVTTTANITQAPVYIAAGLSAQNKTYDTTAVASVTSSGPQTLSGVYAADTGNVTVSSSGPYVGTFASTNAANNIAVTVDTTNGAVSGATLSGGAAGNYYVAGVTQTLAANITPAPLTISGGLTAANKVYDATTAAMINGSSPVLSGLVGSDAGTSNVVVSSSGPYTGSFANANFGTAIVVNPTTTTTTINGVAYTTMAGITMSGPSATNYYVTGPTTPLTANITKAILTVSAENQASFVTQTPNSLTSNSVVTYNYSGLFGSDTVTGATTAAVVSPTNLTALTNASAANTYAAVVSNATGTGLSNYTINYVSAVYTIVPAGQLVIKTNGAVTTYGTAPSYGSITASYLVSTSGPVINTFTLSPNTNGAITTYTGNDGAGTSISFNLTPVNASNSTSLNTNVGNYSLQASNLAITGNNLSSNSPVTVTGNLLVNPLAVTVSVSPSSTVYNGQTQAQAAPVVSPAILSGDNVNFSGAATGKNVGSYGSSLAASGADIADYRFTFNNAALTITPYIINFGSNGGGNNAGPGIVASANNRVYNTTTIATGALTMTGLFAGDVVNATYANANFNNANAGTGKTVTFSGISLSGAAANNYSIGSTVPVTATANITTAPVYINGGLTAQNKVYDTTTAAVVTAGTITLSGVLGSDAVIAPVAGNYGSSFAFATPNAGSSIAVSPILSSAGGPVAGLALGGAQSGNYYIAGIAGAQTLAANITPAPLTISGGLSAQNKVYDTTTAATITVSGTQTLAGVFSADNNAVAVAPTSSYTGSFSQSNYGTGLTVSPTMVSTTIGGVAYNTMAGVSLIGAKAGNYYVTGPTTSLTADITKAALTITANNQVSFVTQTPNDVSSNSVVGYSVSGLLGSDAVTGMTNSTANLTVVTAINATAGLLSSSTPAGTYFTNVSGATGTGLSNYAITYIPGAYTVAPAGQLLIKTNGAVTTYGTLPNYSSTNPLSPTASYMSTSGGNAISTISLSSATSAGVTIYSGNDGAGTTISFNIVPVGASLSGSGNIPVGAYALTTANLTVTGNNVSNAQAVVTGNLQVTPLAVTISATPTSLMYNGASQNQSAYTTSPAILANDVVTINGGIATGKNVGTYSSNLSTTGADAGNYQFTYHNANLVITPYLINPSSNSGPNISATANNKVYDTTTAATGALTMTGLFAGDVVNANYANANFANANVGTAKTVTFTGITLSGPAAANYAMTTNNPGPVTATANITPAPLTINGLQAQNKTYDGNTVAIINGTPRIVGLLGADTSTLTGNVMGGTFASANPGQNLTVTANLSSLTLGNSNYYIAGVTLPLSANIYSSQVPNLIPGILQEIAPPPSTPYQFTYKLPTNDISDDITQDGGNNVIVDAINSNAQNNTENKNSDSCSSKDILFATGSASLTAQSKQFLLKCQFKEPLTVIGSTDDVGTASYNQELAIRRAQSVINFLKKYRGLQKATAKAIGMSAPVMPNVNAASRQQNRRATIQQGQ